MLQQRNLQDRLRHDISDGFSLLVINFFTSPLQKLVYKTNSSLDYHMIQNHQKLDFWILLTKDMCVKLEMKLSIVDSNMYCKGPGIHFARL